jgi:hypothetical protein
MLTISLDIAKMELLELFLYYLLRSNTLLIRLVTIKLDKFLELIEC